MKTHTLCFSTGRPAADGCVTQTGSCWRCNQTVTIDHVETPDGRKRMSDWVAAHQHREAG